MYSVRRVFFSMVYHSSHLTLKQRHVDPLRPGLSVAAPSDWEALQLEGWLLSTSAEKYLINFCA